MDIRELAFRMAVKNAVLHKGKANVKAVLNYMLGSQPDLRGRIREIIPVIREAVERVNALSLDEQKELAIQFGLEKSEESKGLPPLKNVKGEVVTRFPPEPSGYPHIGHAKAAIIGHEYARMHNGKFVLRFDDTNPEKAKIEYYTAIKEGLEWLGLRWDVEKSTSDDMEIIYREGEKLLRAGHLYVCTCKPEEIKKGRAEGRECSCRERSPEENLELWRKMFSEFEQGSAVVRLKGDMRSSNTAMRDPTMFRIVDSFHPKTGTKYRVWPTYDFAVVVEDHLDGVTHMIRSKEYELRDDVYRYLMGLLGYDSPEIISISRLKIRGYPVSKRKLRMLIEEGKLLSWDDPRVPTLAGLRRRGIQPEAIREFVLSLGVTKSDSVIEMETLLSFNRKFLDPRVPRRFFVPEPVRVEVEGAPEKVAVLKNHPTLDFGTREIRTKGVFFLPKADIERIKEGELIRLKDLYNIRIVEKGDAVKAEYAGDSLLDVPKVQWVTEENVKARVAVPGPIFKNGEFNENSLEIVEGLAEKSVENFKIDDIIQFERFGFCRVDQMLDGMALMVKSHD